MQDIAVAFMVPTIVFLVIVMPIWLVLHYRSKRQAGASLSDAERGELEALGEIAESMSTRIETLESILDAESPGWRERSEES